MESAFYVKENARIVTRTVFLLVWTAMGVTFIMKTHVSHVQIYIALSVPNPQAYVLNVRLGMFSFLMPVKNALKIV